MAGLLKRNAFSGGKRNGEVINFLTGGAKVGDSGLNQG
jgi:hypothetical protein